VQVKLHDYVRASDIGGIERELAVGIHIDCPDIPTFDTALHIAAWNDEIDPAIASYLLDRGAALTDNIIQDALRFGSEETIGLILGRCGNADPFPDKNYTSLMYAALGRGYREDSTLLPVFKMLLDRGSDPNVISDFTESALRMVARTARFDAVQLMLDHGADIGQLRWTPLMRAVALGSLEDIEAALRRRGSLKKRDFWGRTPFLISLHMGDLPKATRLLDAGSERDTRGHCKMPPITYAVVSGNESLVEWLIDQGVDVNAADEFGENAIDLAEACEYEGCLELLKRAGGHVSGKRSTPCWFY
jgi:ankyrin repeat protein